MGDDNVEMSIAGAADSPQKDTKGEAVQMHGGDIGLILKSDPVEISCRSHYIVHVWVQFVLIVFNECNCHVYVRK